MANTPGHRDLTLDEVELIARIKDAAKHAKAVLAEAAELEGVNPEFLMKARMDAESYRMFGVTAVTDR